MPAALWEDSRDRDAKRLWLPRWTRRLALFLALYSPFVCALYQMVEVGEHPLVAAVLCTSQWDDEIGEDEGHDGVGHPHGDVQGDALPSFPDHAVAAPVSKLTGLMDLAPASQVQDILPPIPLSA